MARRKYDPNAPTVDGMLETLERIAAEYNRRTRESLELLTQIRERVGAGKQPSKAQFKQVDALFAWRDEAADGRDGETVGALHESLAHCALVLTGQCVKDAKGNWVLV